MRFTDVRNPEIEVSVDGNGYPMWMYIEAHNAVARDRNLKAEIEALEHKYLLMHLQRLESEAGK